jgi:hypothetical protein
VARVNVYIDGFNLYYGIKKWPAYKWLNIVEMLDSLFPNDEVALTRYFTANVKGKMDPRTPQRQNAYLRALGTLAPRLEVRTSRFLVNPVWMPLAHPVPGDPDTVEVIKTEEKGSDVNLATYLLLDAFERSCEMAVVVSNDSDLREPIRIVQAAPFDLPVTVMNPFRRFKAEMAAGRHLNLKVADVRDHQFPDQVLLANGKTVTRPTKWR